MADSASQGFGKYVLVSKLAAGGMAVTYRARLTGAAGVTKQVVIKKILPHYVDDSGFVEMFISEARVAAGLSHGNIAQVFDFGEVNGEYFIAMEFVHGQPLSRVLHRAAKLQMPFVPTPLALHIAMKMCDGLHYAHTRIGEDGQPLHLVHRDVSPENVLISYEGEVKIVDFGIAKSATAGASKTEPGLVKGKFPYFSPEQAKAVPDLDSRTDVFATGVVLYEMLCGRRPYEGEFMQVLPKIVKGDFPAPSSLNPDITPPLEQIMLTGMARKREERYQSAKELGQALSENLYRDAPSFSPDALTHLMGHLFTKELEAEGRAVSLPKDFLEQLTTWRRSGEGAPARTPVAGQSTPSGRSNRIPRVSTGAKGVKAYDPNETRLKPETRAAPVTGSTRIRSAAANQTRLDPLPEDDLGRESLPHDTPPETPAVDERRAAHIARAGQSNLLTTEEAAALAAKRQKLVLVLAVPMFLLAALALTVYLVSSKKKPEETLMLDVARLWLTSEPAEAKVKLDGKEIPGVTPLIIPNLVVGEAHTLVVTAPERLPWTKRFTPTTSAQVTLHAELKRPAAETAAGTEPAEGVDAGAPGPAKRAINERNEAHYPLRMMVLRPANNAVPIPEYQTATIDLEPGRAYSVWTEGGFSKGGRAASNTVLYFIEGNTTPRSSYGFLGSSPKTFRGVRKLHAFIIDDNPDDNRGGLRINLRESKYTPPKLFTFDAKANALYIKPEHKFVLHNLNPESEYLLTIRDDFAMTREGNHGRVGAVLCIELSAEPRPLARSHRIFEAGKRYTVVNTQSLECMFLDDRVGDNSGALEVDIVDVAEARKAGDKVEKGIR